ncbi:MAG: choice-of-anchor L domain-containing protein [Saprospiraceae bacterium]|nr:choice-of-anchor L domain-containing protein [Saprospiraceae bacterium]
MNNTCTPPTILSILACCFSFLETSAQTQTPLIPELDARKNRSEIVLSGTWNPFQVNHLLPGRTYQLALPASPEMPFCTPSVFGGNDQQPLVQNQHAWQFKAPAAQTTFYLKYPCSWDESTQHPHQMISVACIDCQEEKPALNLSEVTNLQVQRGMTPTALVRDVLIGGDCFDIANVSYSGDSTQIGTFSNGLSNIGFDNGIIMATGNTNIALGPNNRHNGGTNLNSIVFDSELAMLAGGTIYDRCVLEFDFTPTQSPIVFEYVFASEEYCEWVGSQFNDVFGFFISGPGIVGSQNLALVPTSLQPVSINTINDILNSNLYTHNMNNNPAYFPDFCGIPAATGPATTEIQYDGFTKKMQATVNVVPCQTYHIKLKISDVADGNWDSAVFLRAGSFNAGGNASVDWQISTDQTNQMAHEGCSQVNLVFDRIGTNTTNALNVPFLLSGTATNGVDYTGMPASIIIPAGQDKVVYPITIINDGIIEGNETIIIRPNNPCSCLNPETSIIITDANSFAATADTVALCGPGVSALNAHITGGLSPFTYLWSSGATTTGINAPLTATDASYTVTITDACNNSSTATALLRINPPPTAQIASTPQICPGGTGQMQIQFSGNGPFDFQYSINTNIQPVVSNITQNPYILNINQTGQYQLLNITDGGGCVGTVGGPANVTTSTLSMNAIGVPVTCFGASTGAIQTSVSGGQMPFHFVWSGPVALPPDVPAQSALSSGTYTVTLIDAAGCTDVETILLSEPTDIVATAQSSGMANCANPTGGAIQLGASGGASGYTYIWSNGATTQNINNLGQGSYSVTVTDANSCKKIASATVNGDFVPPAVTANASNIITCLNTTANLNSVVTPATGNYDYAWVAPTGVTTLTGQASAQATTGTGGTYQLEVTNNANGCTAQTSVMVTENRTPPGANAGPDALINCIVQQVSLSGQNNPQGANYQYLWTAANGGVITGGVNAPAVQATAGGTYNLQITNTINGCTSTDATAVTVDTLRPTAVIAPADLLTCSVTEITLQATSSSANTQYNWTASSGGNIVSGATSLTPVVDHTGTYQLRLSNNVNGCSRTLGIDVEEETNKPVDILPQKSDATCKGNDGKIEFVNVQGGIQPILYSIDNGQTFLDKTLFENLSGGAYSLVVQDANGCEYAENLTLTQAPNPVIELEPFHQIQLGETVDLRALIPSGFPITSIDTLIWTPLEGLIFDSIGKLTIPELMKPIAYPTGNMTYTVTLVDVNGCTATDRTTIEVDQTPLIYIPNAFTPDHSKGGNDLVYISAKIGQVKRVKSFQIFNRWGEMVFQRLNFLPNDPQFGWDGNHKGKPLNPAVFGYWAEIELINGQSLQFEGDITLIR